MSAIFIVKSFPNIFFKVVNFNNIISLTENFVPVIIAFYIGSWSDKFGRKPFIALFMAGTFIDLIGTLLSGIFLDEINKYVWLAISLPARSITGGSRTFSQMVTCFASDNSSPRFCFFPFHRCIDLFFQSQSNSRIFQQIFQGSVSQTCSCCLHV